MDKDKIQSFLLLITLSLIWGSSFILIKKGLIAYSALEVGALRILISAVIFLPYVLLNLRNVPWKKLKYIVIFGMFEIGFPPFLFAIAQTKIDSSTAGILNSLVPLFTLLTGLMFFKLKFGIYKILGVLLGLVGAILLVISGNDGGIELSQLSFGSVFGLFIVLATFFYGIGTNMLKEYLQNVKSRMTTALAFVSMGIPSILILVFFTDFFSKSITDSQNLMSFGAISILSIVGSALAIILLGILVQKSNALFASFVTYLIPVVALTWGFLDGEILNYMHFLSLLLILGGIYLANRSAFKLKTALNFKKNRNF